MTESFIIRQATESDVSFIAEAIIAAEKSGTDILGYSKIYEIEEPVFINLLKKMLLEDIEGQELCISGFLILEENGQNAACCCSWIEESCGISSSILKSTLLASYIPKPNLEKASAKSHLFREILLTRSKGAIQIESVYTKKDFRGKGYCLKVIKEQVKRFQNAAKPISKVELIVTGHNGPALKTYAKAGFEIAVSKTANNKELIPLLSSDTLILMKSDIKNFI